MPWIIYMLASWILALVVVRNPGIRKMWPAGLAAVVVTLLADTTLVNLGAFRFNNTIYELRGVPIFYILGNFTNGMLLARIVSPDGILKPVLTVSMAAAFLFIEWGAIQLGYFQYFNWSYLHSLGLNIIGFIAVLWVADLLELRHHRYNPL